MPPHGAPCDSDRLSPSRTHPAWQQKTLCDFVSRLVSSPHSARPTMAQELSHAHQATLSCTHLHAEDLFSLPLFFAASPCLRVALRGGLQNLLSFFPELDCRQNVTKSCSLAQREIMDTGGGGDFK
jgi:hypothetical protein